MRNSSGKLDKGKLLSIVVPVALAIIVVIALAISGNVTKKNDIIAPSGRVELVTEAVTAPVPENTDTSVSIISVGDNLIHNTCISAGLQSDGSYNYDSFYAKTKSYISAADLAIINQETILGGPDFEYTGYPVFNSPYEIGDASIKAGFDVFTCATNHSLDMGSQGVLNECNYFAQHLEVTHLGTHDSQESHDTIAYVEKNGIKFAMLNYTNSTNGIPFPDGKDYLVSMFDEDEIRADLKEARKNADVVMVFPHWGTEDSHLVDDFQRKYVQIFLEEGVDIVIGTHPHVLQPVEWVTDEETGRKMIVYYSIGNFVSHQIQLDEMCGGMAEIKVERKNGKIEITSAKLAPVVDYYTRTDNGFAFTVYKFGDYTEEIAKTQAQPGTTKAYYEQMVKDVIDEEFLDLD